jgi:hypothetical protein
MKEILSPALPAWIAQEVFCHSFCVERIFSLDFFAVGIPSGRSFLSRKKNIKY